MNGNGGPANVPPFPPEYRASGLLLHVTSLPSPYGIGDLRPSPFPGSIFSMTPASVGGNPFRSDQRVMGIRPISRCRLQIDGELRSREAAATAAEPTATATTEVPF